MNRVDVCVVGAGHAGVEAALACARLGMKTILFTMSLDAIANLPCNPSIGGTAKGHLVYEIDALGGEMGRGADLVTLQSRTLNLGKGAAVYSKRIQADRMMYRSIMKSVLENTENLRVIQAEVTDIKTSEHEGIKKIDAVVTRLGEEYPCQAAILCTGTYLNGTVHTGNICSLRRGDIDIIVGTHRLLSQDVQFRDLGLVIIDEEQRFGVAHKEKLKQLAKNVDVLTLTFSH